MAQFIGKLIGILPVVTGENARGAWCRGGIVVMPQDEYSKPAKFTACSQQKLDLISPLQIGSVVIVEFKPESREINGNWYTDLMIQRISVAQKVGG